MTEKPESARQVVLFDDVCVLCNETMRFLYQHDRRHNLWYASLQGELAKTLRQRHSSMPKGLNSVVFVENYQQADEKVFLHSDAALQIARQLSGFWRLLAWASVIPRPMRDAVYLWVARNRYHWFGRKESCSLPEPAMRSRFLDD